MRKILYAVLIAATFFVPLERVDVAKLEPVEAVAMDYTNGTVILKTDTGRWGRGATPGEALEDMKTNTPAVIYLNTARFVLVSRQAEECLPLLLPLLRQNITVGGYCGMDVKEELAYLKTHIDKGKPLI